jgi:signal transduction histidine kinase
MSQAKKAVVIAVLVFFLVYLNIHPMVQAASDGYNILILNSYHPGYRWSDNEMTGIQSVLTEDDVVTIEFMDTKRIESPEYLDQLIELYRMKYAGEKFDLIFTLDDRAYQFMLEYHDELFSGVPVVFAGVNRFAPEEVEDISWITGTVETFDYSKLLSLIKYLIPDCETVYVVTDSTYTGLAYRTQLRDLQEQYTLAMPLAFVGDFEKGLSWDELLYEISHLPSDSAILYMSYTRDSEGNVINIVEATDTIAQTANVPVFVDHTQLHRNGVVGGLVKDPFREGVTAGEMGLQILEGKAPSEIPIKLEANTIYQFDYNAMSKWDIPIRSIPKNSVMLNEPQEKMVVNRELITWVIALVLLQTTLILLLFWFNRRRKIAENALRDEHLLLEQKVEERTHDLQEALHVKNTFLANMSHELRTPLTAIIGFSELLMSQTNLETQEKFHHSLTHIHRSGQHLLSLINDILTMAKIAADRLDWEETLVKAYNLIRDTVMMVEVKALKKEIDIQTEIDPFVQWLWVDERRIRQVLIILMDNAIKFSPRRSTIKLSIKMKIADINQVVISVGDQGIGIATEDHKRIFNPFVQVENDLSRSYEGSGLGLALAKELIELHKGTIEVESALGEGTTMHVILPAHTLRHRETISEADGSLITIPHHRETHENYQLLLIEDNLTTIDLLKAFLHAEGFHVTSAMDGLEGLDEAQNTNPDLILLDLHLPKLDGFNVIKEIRRIPRHRDTPILVISAIAFEEEIQKCIDLGADAFLRKPFSLKDLSEKINQLLS